MRRGRGEERGEKGEKRKRVRWIGGREERKSVPHIKSERRG